MVVDLVTRELVHVDPNWPLRVMVDRPWRFAATSLPFDHAAISPSVRVFILAHISSFELIFIVNVDTYGFKLSFGAATMSRSATFSILTIWIGTQIQ